MVDLGVPTAYFGPPLDTRIDKLGRIIAGPPEPWYPNVARSKFDGAGALTVYRQIITKEVPKERKCNRYQLRNGLNVPSTANPPHLTDPAHERGSPPVDGGVDVREWGFDPASNDGKFLRRCIDDKAGRRGPQDRLPYSELSQQDVGWLQAKPLEEYRSRSVPVLSDADSTEYEWLRPTLRKNAARKQRKRDKQVAVADARLQQALTRCLSFTFHGDTAKQWTKTKGTTDATSFQKAFIEVMKVPIHKSDPKPGQPVVLKKTNSQAYCEQWKP
jgi:hypothetical protein